MQVPALACVLSLPLLIYITNPKILSFATANCSITDRRASYFGINISMMLQ